MGPLALDDDLSVVMRRTSHGASSARAAREVPFAMAAAISERPLGALRVTCSARRLEAIERAHGAVISECELVDRALPRLVRCVEEEEESGPSSSDGGLRRSLSSGAASADGEGDGKEDDVPLYARRKWKAPMRLDVKVGAKLGEIESVS